MDWVATIITGFVGVGGGAAVVAAMAKWWVDTMKVRYEAAAKEREDFGKRDAEQQGISRQNRADEIVVLHQQIRELRLDRNKDRAYYDEKMLHRDIEVVKLREEVNTARSEHTACLVRCSQLTERVKLLYERLDLPPEMWGELEDNGSFDIRPDPPRGVSGNG